MYPYEKIWQNICKNVRGLLTYSLIWYTAGFATSASSSDLIEMWQTDMIANWPTLQDVQVTSVSTVAVTNELNLPYTFVKARSISFF